MKRIILSTALVLSTAGFASAMTMPNTLSNTDRAEAQSLLPNADFSNLTVAEVQAIANILYNGDGNRGLQIRAILN